MKAKRKANLDEDKIQAKKDKGVEFLRNIGNDDAADNLDAESLESYALRKGIRVDNPHRWRKPVSEITDRQKRMRANHPDFTPALPKKCALCRSTRNVDIDHKDGDEANGARRNLRWLCRSCNTKHGHRLKRLGRGVRTRQYNPGARTLGAYVQAAVDHTRGRHDAGGKVIHETPIAKRQEYARQIWRRRRAAGTDRRMNPATSARKKNMWPFGGKRKRAARARTRGAAVREAIGAGNALVGKAVRDAARGQDRISRIDVKVDARARNRKRNAFGLDRFFGRKSRVTSSDWNRAGKARRAQALRAAGVSKKLLPVYTDLSWRDMQSLEPSFITKVMASLPARKNARRANARKTVARKRPRKANTSGTAIGKKIRELMATGMSQQQAGKAAKRLLRAGHTKPGSYKRSPRRKRRNPDAALDRAGETYAMFHGRGPKEVVTVKQIEGDPKTMTALGDLQYFVVVPGDDESAAYKVAWGAGDKRPFLATNHKATQLYIVGGNQNVDEMLRKMGVTSSSPQDLLDLGEVREVEYYTQKAFDNFTPIRYFHHFGEEDAKRNPRRIRRPRLIYSRRNKKLMLAGGGYKIKKDGIIN
jgi:hypothetical protein